jgi:hypothetical protein
MSDGGFSRTDPVRDPPIFAGSSPWAELKAELPVPVKEAGEFLATVPGFALHGVGNLAMAHAKHNFGGR